MNPLTNSLSLLCWVLILVILLGPFKFIHKLIFLAILVVIYGKQLPIVLYFSAQIAFTLATRSPAIYRSLANALVYQHLKCDTVISLPDRPTIFAVNYPINILEFTLLGIFPPDAVLVADVRQALSGLVMDKERIITIERQHKGNYSIAANKIGQVVRKGLSVIAYVSNAISMKNEDDIGKLHRGMFAISKELRVPLTPVVLDRIRLSPLGAITNKTFRIRVGKVHIVKSVEQSMNYVRSFYTSSLKEFRRAG